jgi:hypothetical protein
MNLEDKIRSSAGGQATHYQAADDLFPRIEHRRRQRAARRMTASAAAAVALFGGGALALTTLRDRDTDPSVANSTELTVEETMAPVTTTATTLGPSTTAPTSPTVPATTVAPDESLPELNIPEVTTPVDDAPMPTANPDGSIGIEFWNVGTWGTEPVFGSGCGASGNLGDTIPDGLWAGFIVDDGSDGSVGIDLLCIYSGEAARNVLAGTTATTINADPNYLIVNNSTRARHMAMAEGISLRLAERRADGRCWDSRSTTQWADIPADRQVWVRIHGGLITWILADCPPQ